MLVKASEATLPVVFRSVIVLLALGLVALLPRPASADERRFEPMRLKSGLVLPYPLDKIFRGWARCRRGRHTHRAIDIGGVGPEWGLGTPIRAIARGKIIHLGLPEDDPKRYGVRDTGPGKVKRGKTMLPKERTLRGYGLVRFFTKNRGRFRTGVLIVTRITGGRLNGYTVKYMHLAAAHPDLKKGSVVLAGQELGVMGGTAVQHDPPHLHLAILNRAGRPVDPGPILGVGSTRWSCRRGKRAYRAARGRVRGKAGKLMKQLARERARVKVVAARPAGCGTWTYGGRFAGDGVRTHRIAAEIGEGDAPVSVRVTASGTAWKPRVELLSSLLTPLYDGRRARGKAGRRVGVKRQDAGRKSGVATFSWRPRAAGSAILHVRSWKRKPPKGATYTIEVKRACE